MKMLFFFDSQENLGLISIFGFMLFLFYIGVKTDMSVVHKTRSGATKLGSIAIIAPYLCSMAVLNSYSSKYLQPEQVRILGSIIGFFCISSFPVIFSNLSDLKILNTELGRIGLSASLVSEVFNVFLASIITFSILHGERPTNGLVCVVAAALYIFMVIFIIRPAMFWIIKQTPEGSHVSDNYVYSILIITLFSGYTSYRFGFFVLIGPYILGLAIPDGPPLGTAIVKKIDTFVNEIFLPIFVTTCCMRVDLKDLLIWRNQSDGSVDYFMVQTLVIVEVIVVTKFVACMITSLCNGMPWNDVVCLSLIMSSKGIVQMAAFSLVRDFKVSILFQQ
jgi:Kef-type K+ transport system membrane component KefB